MLIFEMAQPVRHIPLIFFHVLYRKQPGKSIGRLVTSCAQRQVLVGQLLEMRASSGCHFPFIWLSALGICCCLSWCDIII